MALGAYHCKNSIRSFCSPTGSSKANEFIYTPLIKTFTLFAIAFLASKAFEALKTPAVLVIRASNTFTLVISIFSQFTNKNLWQIINFYMKLIYQNQNI